MLIDVWATWCGPCQEPMQHNQQMLQKNNWGDKVRLVGVTVDDQVETVKQRVDAKGWHKVEHLTLEGWKKQHPLIKGFGVSGIPFLALVDTHGSLVFMGHPSQINLEQKINELISDKGAEPAQAQKKQEDKQQQKVVSLQELSKISQTLGDKKFFDQNFGKLDFISTKLVLQLTAVSGKVTGKAKIQVYVNKEDEAFLEQYEKMLPSKNVKFKATVVQSIAVPEVPQACFQCKQGLKYPLYWCKWSPSQTEFRCRKCVQKKEGDYGFAYKHNSILLTAPTKRIGSYCLGSDIQPAPETDLSTVYPHGFSCNGGCGESPDKPGIVRYISLGARAEPNYHGDFIDVCEDCLFKYLDNNEETRGNLRGDNHLDEHPFLRILYNTNGYYKF